MTRVFRAVRRQRLAVRYQLLAISLLVAIWCTVWLAQVIAIAQENTSEPIPTPANGRIAFASNRDGDYEIYSMNADGSDIQRLTNNEGDDFEPDWSPDGEKIVFISDRDGGDFDIFVMNADGTDVVNLTPDSDKDDIDPAWSPDGTRIAFSRRSESSSDLYVMNSDGSGLVKLVDGEDVRFETSPTWPPDGSQLIFVSVNELPGLNVFGDFTLYKVNADGTGRTAIALLDIDGSPAWSWTNNLIVYFDATNSGIGLYVIGANGKNRRLLREASPTGNQGDRYPAWSPDGMRVVFSSSSSSNTKRDIFVVNVDGTNAVNLSNSPDSDDIQPSWQPIHVATPQSD